MCDEENFHFDLNLDFLDVQTTPQPTQGAPQIVRADTPIPPEARILKSEKTRLKPKNTKLLAERIAHTDNLVQQIQQLERDKTHLFQQLQDFQKTAKEINKLYENEKQELVQLQAKFEKLQSKCQHLDDELAHKTLHHDQLQAQLDETKGPVEYSEMAVKYLKLAQKLDEDHALHRHDQPLIEALSKYCLEHKLKVPAMKSPKKRTRTYKSEKGIQCELWLHHPQFAAPEVNKKEFRSKGVQCTSNTRSQGTQHISTATTRSTSTACFIKKHHVGTSFPERPPQPALNDILQEFLPWDIKSPVSPIVDLTTLEEMCPTPEPTPPLTVSLKTTGTCTLLCNIQRQIDFIPQLPTAIKRSNSRPPSRLMYDSVKHEASTPSPQPAPNTDDVPATNSFLPFSSLANLQPSAFEELWQVFGQMLLGLLHHRSGGAGIAANATVPHNSTANALNQQDFHNWLTSMYGGGNMQQQEQLRTEVPCNDTADTAGVIRPHVRRDFCTVGEDTRHSTFRGDQQSTSSHHSIATSPIRFTPVLPSEYETASAVNTSLQDISPATICLTEANTVSAFKVLQHSTPYSEPTTDEQYTSSNLADEIFSVFSEQENCKEKREAIRKLLKRSYKQRKRTKKSSERKDALKSNSPNLVKTNQTAVDFIAELSSFTEDCKEDVGRPVAKAELEENIVNGLQNITSMLNSQYERTVSSDTDECDREKKEERVRRLQDIEHSLFGSDTDMDGDDDSLNDRNTSNGLEAMTFHNSNESTPLWESKDGFKKLDGKTQDIETMPDIVKEKRNIPEYDVENVEENIVPSNDQDNLPHEFAINEFNQANASIQTSFIEISAGEDVQSNSNAKNFSQETNSIIEISTDCNQDDIENVFNQNSTASSAEKSIDTPNEHLRNNFEALPNTDQSVISSQIEQKSHKPEELKSDNSPVTSSFDPNISLSSLNETKMLNDILSVSTNDIIEEMLNSDPTKDDKVQLESFLKLCDNSSEDSKREHLPTSKSYTTPTKCMDTRSVEQDDLANEFSQTNDPVQASFRDVQSTSYEANLIIDEEFSQEIDSIVEITSDSNPDENVTTQKPIDETTAKMSIEAPNACIRNTWEPLTNVHRSPTLNTQIDKIAEISPKAEELKSDNSPVTSSFDPNISLSSLIDTKMLNDILSVSTNDIIEEILNTDATKNDKVQLESLLKLCNAPEHSELECAYPDMVTPIAPTTVAKKRGRKRKSESCPPPLVCKRSERLRAKLECMENIGELQISPIIELGKYTRRQTIRNSNVQIVEVKPRLRTAVNEEQTAKCQNVDNKINFGFFKERESEEKLTENCDKIQRNEEDRTLSIESEDRHVRNHLLTEHHRRALKERATLQNGSRKVEFLAAMTCKPATDFHIAKSLPSERTEVANAPTRRLPTTKSAMDSAFHYSLPEPKLEKSLAMNASCYASLCPAYGASAKTVETLIPLEQSPAYRSPASLRNASYSSPGSPTSERNATYPSPASPPASKHNPFYYSPSSPPPPSSMTSEPPLAAKEIPLELNAAYLPNKRNSLLNRIICNYSADENQTINGDYTTAEREQRQMLHNEIKKYLESATSQNPDVEAANLIRNLNQVSQCYELIVAAIVEQMKEVPRPEVELSCAVEAVPPKFVGAYHRRIAFVIRHLQYKHQEFSTELLAKIESALFNFNNVNNVSLGVALNLTQLYLLVVNQQMSHMLENPARVFVAKCLYYYKKKSIPMIYEVLCCFPTTLPHHEDLSYDRSDALITVIQHSLMCTTYDMDSRDLRTKELLSKLRFEYHFQPFKPDFPEVLTNIIDKLKAGKLTHIRYAFAIFCKRCHPTRVLNDVLKLRLIPLANEYYQFVQQTNAYDERIAALLECISMVLKPLPIDTDVSVFLSLFARFLNAVQRPVIQESSVKAILRLQRFGQVSCFNALMNFKPVYELSFELKAMLKTFIHRKPLHFWKTLEMQSTMVAD